MNEMTCVLDSIKRGFFFSERGYPVYHTEQDCKGLLVAIEHVCARSIIRRIKAKLSVVSFSTFDFDAVVEDAMANGCTGFWIVIPDMTKFISFADFADLL